MITVYEQVFLTIAGLPLLYIFFRMSSRYFGQGRQLELKNLAIWIICLQLLIVVLDFVVFERVAFMREELAISPFSILAVFAVHYAAKLVTRQQDPLPENNVAD